MPPVVMLDLIGADPVAGERLHELGALLGAALHDQRVRDGMGAPRALRLARDGIATAMLGRFVVAGFLVGKSAHRLEVGEVGRVSIPRRCRALGDVTHPLALAAPEQFELRQAMGDDVARIVRQIGFEKRDTALQFTGVGRAH